MIEAIFGYRFDSTKADAIPNSEAGMIYHADGVKGLMVKLKDRPETIYISGETLSKFMQAFSAFGDEAIVDFGVQEMTEVPFKTGPEK